jgi:hypothetical protein|tara:strand:+ start:539 stop:667 length:129 start_codon:yes stop_codon:yes gene_type:complete
MGRVAEKTGFTGDDILQHGVVRGIEDWVEYIFEFILKQLCLA